ncbi:hypothetical protein KFU94_33860 [Chloroflexi bacterium TSY]|nr:hypothetical protein [Chloroflexi bacterium TSY]
MSSATVNRRVATLSRFFDYLADEAEDESWSNPVVWRLHRLDTGCHLPRDIAERIVRQLWGERESRSDKRPSDVGLDARRWPAGGRSVETRDGRY